MVIDRALTRKKEGTRPNLPVLPDRKDKRRAEAKQEQGGGVKTAWAASASSNAVSGWLVSALIILVPYTTPALTYIMNIQQSSFEKSGSKIYDQTPAFAQNIFPISELKGNFVK